MKSSNNHQKEDIKLASSAVGFLTFLRLAS